jgi:transketolase
MINEKAKLNPNMFEEDAQKNPTRNGFGDGLVQAGKDDENVVALTADLSESVRTHKFAKEFPDRFFEVGIAEQNLASVASGLAAVGKIPFAASYAIFHPGRSWEQIRSTICYNDQPVKIIGSHSGLLTGPDGGTHQALEDIAITRVMPNMVVISPCDEIEARKATIAMAKTAQPTYLRLSREKTVQITTEETPFEIGKGVTLWTYGKPDAKAVDGIQKTEKLDVGIITTGVVTHRVLKVAKELERAGTKVEVLNIHTIKPIDQDAIIDLARRAGAIVTVEEHQIAGGLGSAVSEVLSANAPTPQEFVGVNDRYGQSGDGFELWDVYGLSENDIVMAVEKVIGRK